MKKIILLSLLSFALVGSIFAAETDIQDGIVNLADIGEASGTSANTTFHVQAEATGSELGLLLKYGNTDINANEVDIDDIIKKSNTENWDVFGADQTTDNFYFFGYGRAIALRTVDISLAASNFLKDSGDDIGFDSLVTPTFTSSQGAVTAFDNLVIPKTNAVGGTYLEEYFQIVWNGSGSTVKDTAPAGTYTSTITVTVANN